jgi:hypothetical protein
MSDRATLVSAICLKASVIVFIGIAILLTTDQIVGFHVFRQTQTAMAVREIVRGAGWFDFTLPAYGMPWAIPLEFPIYQIMVAVLTKLGAPMVLAGRLLGALFFLAVLLPMRGIQRQMKWPDECFVISALLYCSNPLIVAWATSFMIEGLCLFLGMCWLYFVIRASRGGDRFSFALGCGFGILANVTKATIVPSFGLLSLLAILSSPSRRSVRGSAAALMIGVPLLAGLAWSHWTEQIRAENPLIGFLYSGQLLREWIFGSLEQRLSGEFYAFWENAPRTIFGLADVFALIAIAVGISDPSTRRPSLAAVAAFVIAPLIFSNLFIVHEYYLLENCIFLIGSIGITCGYFVKNRNKNYLFSCILIFTIQIYYIYKKINYYYMEIRPALSQRLIAEAISAETLPGSSIIVLQDDASPAIPFFADRYAASLRQTIPLERIIALTQDPQRFLGNHPLAAIAVCSHPVDDERRAIIEQFVAGRREIGRSPRCRAYAYP